MYVTALQVQQAADVVFRTDFPGDFGGIEHAQVVVAVTLPAAFLLSQAFELLLVQRGKNAAGLVVALDVVLFDARTNDVGTFEDHAAEHFGGFVAIALLDDIDVAAVGVDQLPAIATTGAVTDLGGFQHGDAVARFAEKQGRRQTGVARADNTDIALDQLFEHRKIEGLVAGRGVVAVYVFLHD
ncbi:hypothetical protein D3C71_1595630 [compost metagenome]